MNVRRQNIGVASSRAMWDRWQSWPADKAGDGCPQVMRRAVEPRVRGPGRSPPTPRLDHAVHKSAFPTKGAQVLSHYGRRHRREHHHLVVIGPGDALAGIAPFRGRSDAIK